MEITGPTSRRPTPHIEGIGPANSVTKLNYNSNLKFPFSNKQNEWQRELMAKNTPTWMQRRKQEKHVAATAERPGQPLKTTSNLDECWRIAWRVKHIIPAAYDNTITDCRKPRNHKQNATKIESSGAAKGSEKAVHINTPAEKLDRRCCNTLSHAWSAST